VSAAALLRTEGVTKRFGETTVVDDVSIEVRAREVVCVIGPSGSGKTTLLRCLNGLEAIDGGRIWIADRVLPNPAALRGRARRAAERALVREQRDIGFVFQRFNLWPHRTAVENVALGPRRVLGIAPERARSQALELLERVGMAPFADAHPQRLSGGQQQRVAIARALAMRPRLMLFDEPTSALDPEMVGGVLEVMRELAEQGMTMICVTHEMGFARDVAHRVLMMDHGRVVEDAPAHAFFDAPANPRTRTFLAQVR
jgi:polar amino acid transport system ATP-binding protein